MNFLFLCLSCIAGSSIGAILAYSLMKKETVEEEPLNIRIKYFDNGVEKIKKYNYGDWIDLRAEIDMDFYEGDYKLIPLNVAMELPKGYEAHIVPRSSTFKNYGLIQTNSTGIVDCSYCGDSDKWYMPAYCLKPKHGITTHINKGDRICQFRIVKNQDIVYINEVNVLGNKNRGGIGSTGVE